MPRDLHGFAPLWVGIVILLVFAVVWGRESAAVGALQRSIDGAVEDALVDLSESWNDSAAKDLADAGVGRWIIVVLNWAVVILLIAWKRWRHLAVFLGSAALVAAVSHWFPTAGVEGTSVPGHPSEAAAALAVTLAAVVYGVAPAGRWRLLAQAASAAVCLALGSVLLLTRQDTTSEIAIGFAIGFAIPFLGFRVFTPESVFPVSYRRGRSAHLDVSGRRGEAIGIALREQLGIETTNIEPFGLAGSGGSTPLRITLADGRHLFAKLYAESHLRADRWYKLGRTIQYGALEDERSFNSVRRMVEYEDYMLRYLRDSGVRAAEPFGFVEITPEREYLLVTSFVEDALEISDATIDGSVIRSAIDTVRALWDAGVAHRDIKPANVLVRGSDVYLIDVFFCQVRPSAWRQSVDLANMMLLLALGSDTQRVYEAALLRFAPEEVAEAFAATRSVTIPTQLRKMVMADERSLAKEFSLLTPSRRRIPVQRWTIRRLALTGALLSGIAIALATTFELMASTWFGP